MLKERVYARLEQQDWRCALTGIQFATEGNTDDPEFYCSLDRIDSNGHYEPGKLQVVCRFINRWKGDDDNTKFKELLNYLSSSRRILSRYERWVVKNEGIFKVPIFSAAKSPDRIAANIIHVMDQSFRGFVVWK